MAKKNKLYDISKHVLNKEKVAWNREKVKIDKLIKTLEPIESEILNLQAKKVPIYDKIQVIRKKMVAECIHPYEYLIDCGDYVECKFCLKKIRLGVNNGSEV